jgi:hypothetical protein
MSSLASPPRSSSDVAYWCHVALAVIVCVAMAMQIHLWAIEASPEVVGGGIFLVVIWLALPAVLLVVLALYFSAKAAERQLLVLSALLITLCLALGFSAPMAVPSAVGALYVLLVLNFGIRRRKRVNSV